MVVVAGPLVVAGPFGWPRSSPSSSERTWRWWSTSTRPSSVGSPVVGDVVAGAGRARDRGRPRLGRRWHGEPGTRAVGGRRGIRRRRGAAGRAVLERELDDVAGRERAAVLAHGHDPVHEGDAVRGGGIGEGGDLAVAELGDVLELVVGGGAPGDDVAAEVGRVARRPRQADAAGVLTDGQGQVVDGLGEDRQAWARPTSPARSSPTTGSAGGITGLDGAGSATGDGAGEVATEASGAAVTSGAAVDACGAGGSARAARRWPPGRSCRARGAASAPRRSAGPPGRSRSSCRRS